MFFFVHSRISPKFTVFLNHLKKGLSSFFAEIAEGPNGALGSSTISGQLVFLVLVFLVLLLIHNILISEFELLLLWQVRFVLFDSMSQTFKRFQ